MPPMRLHAKSCTNGSAVTTCSALPGGSECSSRLLGCRHRQGHWRDSGSGGRPGPCGAEDWHLRAAAGRLQQGFQVRTRCPWGDWFYPQAWTSTLVLQPSPSLPLPDSPGRRAAHRARVGRPQVIVSCGYYYSAVIFLSPSRHESLPAPPGRDLQCQQCQDAASPLSWALRQRARRGLCRSCWRPGVMVIGDVSGGVASSAHGLADLGQGGFKLASWESPPLVAEGLDKGFLTAGAKPPQPLAGPQMDHPPPHPQAPRLFPRSDSTSSPRQPQHPCMLNPPSLHASWAGGGPLLLPSAVARKGLAGWGSQCPPGWGQAPASPAGGSSRCWEPARGCCPPLACGCRRGEPLPCAIAAQRV